MSRAPTLALAALTAVLALAGCGSGGGGDSTASTASAPQPTATTRQSSSTNEGNTSNAQKPSSTEQGKQSNPAPDLPPPTPGSKAAAPGVPTSRQGDDSIQTWGLEASDAQRKAASATVQRYLDARAARNWATVCHLLAAKPRAEQSQFAQGASCAKAMESFAANAHTSVLEEEAQVDVLSFRAGGKYSFLIYRRPDGIFATALSQEGGKWKLISVTPNPVE